MKSLLDLGDELCTLAGLPRVDVSQPELTDAELTELARIEKETF